jgi:hypothetical protein
LGRTEEVRGHNQFPVLRQKFLAGRPSNALRCRFNPVSLQNVGDCAASEFASKIRYGTLNAAISPVAVLFRHLNDEVLDFGIRARSAGVAMTAAIIFLCN